MGSRPKVSSTARVRQLRRLLRREGVPGIERRLRIRAAEWLRPPGSTEILVSRDELRAASASDTHRKLPAPAPWRAGEPIRAAFVCTPPAPGSGGHTTLFRMAAALEAAGHECCIYLRDDHAGELSEHTARIRRWWPWLAAEVRDLADGIRDSHVVFATGWESAYAVLASPALGVRCYLVQDFEPAFYPAGTQYLLAEATYRFGFHGVTAGRWLAHKLQADYGMQADHFDFGCDLDRYRLREGEPSARAGVCYYCRPSTPRRAHELAVAALDLFAERHPDVPIHVYGEPVRFPFPVQHHGLMTPDQLSELYNRCVAGLVLSATNVSLVPQEMLAAGCIPVVNDAAQNHLVLDNDQVVYAPATPFDLADALSELVSQPSDVRTTRARGAAASVRSHQWAEAGREFEQIVRAVVTERSVT